MNKKIVLACVMSALWLVTMAAIYPWSGTVGIAWTERIVCCMALTTIALIPPALYRIKKPVPCPVR